MSIKDGMLSLRLFLCCCCFLTLGNAQEPVYRHYTIDEGLPSNEVYDVYEDKSGYTWFATDHGISCFDGYSFRNYSTNDGLVHNTVFGFQPDQQGRVWMRTLNSSLCYMENKNIQAYKHNAKLQAFLGRDFIQRFAFDKAGNLWFVNVSKDLGLFFQDAMSGEIKKIKLQSGYNAFIMELDNGELIAGMDFDNGYTGTELPDNSICYVNNTWLFRVPIPGTWGASITNCLKTGPSSFIFTYDNQFTIIENGQIVYRNLFPHILRKCYADAQETNWLCSDGVSIIGDENHRGFFLLKNYTVTSMLQDRMGNYWFTTGSNGIYMARNLRVFTLNRLGNQEPGELLDLEIYRDNLYVLSRTGNVFDMRINENGIDSLNSSLAFINRLSPHCFYFERTKQHLFITGDIYKKESPGNWTEKKSLITDFIVGGIRGYAQAGDSIFLATNYGWIIKNRNNDFIYNSQADGFSRFCTAIAVDKNKKVWVGSTDGLYTSSGTTTLPFEKDNPIFRQRVTDIAFGKNNEVFISTRGAGLIVIDGDKRYYLRTTNGLTSDQCGNICVDGNIIWVCSNNGLNKISYAHKDGNLSFTIERITTEQGLPSNMVSDAERSGDLLFLATGKGLAWFDVKKIQLNTTPPPVYINSFLTNNKEADPGKNALTWKDNNISIEFIALLFRSAGHVNYRYRLEGYEQEWNYTSDRVARYFNLPPGDYTFNVSAMNENGIWNEHPASIHFVIPAHFTETGWFRFIMILLIAGVSAGIVYILVRQQRNKARNVLALSLAEQKALRAQMKPHFIFNALNSIQNFIITHDDDSAHIYLTSFAQLMRRVLDHSRHSTITLHEELQTMGIYLELEKLRFGETFVFVIEVEPDIQHLLIPPLFIQPYVENAIWHGLQLQKNAPRLSIRFFTEKNKLVCVIEDNGIGRKRSASLKHPQGHSSTGMKNVDERISLLNSTTREKISVEIFDLSDAEGNATGTRVVLYFPVNKKEEN